MATQRVKGYPVLIIGAGRGGSALLEMFLDDNLVEVIAIADPNPAAPGIKLANSCGIPAYADVGDALRACKDHPECIVYNLTHDDSVTEQVGRISGNKNVASGVEAKLIWQMVTNLKRVKGELEKSQAQLQAIIYHAMDGIITINIAGEILGFNPAAEKIFGHTQQEMLGRNLKMLMGKPAGGEQDSISNWFVLTGQGHIADVCRREVLAVRKDGVHFPMELSASEMMLSGQPYFIGIVRDITERKLAEYKISHLAHYDYLTDIPNRVLFMDRLGQAVSLASRGAYRVAVLFLDLDGFKQVNDTLGHDSGDLLLQAVANRLKESVRTSDTLARVGGDEFTLVLNNIGSGENAALVANKILAALAEPYDLKGQCCHVGASIGISLFPDDSKESEKLTRQADEAMYLAKQSGKNTYRFFRDILGDAPVT